MKDADFAELAWTVNQNLHLLTPANKRELEEIFEAHRQEVVGRFNRTQASPVRAEARSVSVAFRMPRPHDPPPDSPQDLPRTPQRSQSTPVRSQQTMREISQLARDEKLTDEQIAEGYAMFVGLHNAAIVKKREAVAAEATAATAAAASAILTAKARAAAKAKAKELHAFRKELDESVVTDEQLEKGRELVIDRSHNLDEIVARQTAQIEQLVQIAAHQTGQLDRLADEVKAVSAKIDVAQTENRKADRETTGRLEYMRSRLVRTNIFDVKWHELPAVFQKPLIKYTAQAVLLLAKLSLNLVTFVLKDVLFVSVCELFKSVSTVVRLGIATYVVYIVFFNVLHVYRYRMAEVTAVSESPVGVSIRGLYEIIATPTVYLFNQVRSLEPTKEEVIAETGAIAGEVSAVVIDRLSRAGTSALAYVGDAAAQASQRAAASTLSTLNPWNWFSG